MIEPLAIGTVYDGQQIVEIVASDSHDADMPYLYQLEDGTTVWIPADEH